MSVTPVEPRSESTLSMTEALSRSKPLARLSQRLQESVARTQVVRALLGEPLAGQVRPGPLDAEGWSLLADNNGVAAKLRQWRPRLERALAEAGFPAVELRIRVHL